MVADATSATYERERDTLTRRMQIRIDERDHALMRLGESLETEKEWMAMCGTIGAERDTLSTELSMSKAAERTLVQQTQDLRRWARWATLIAILAVLSHLIFH